MLRRSWVLLACLAGCARPESAEATLRRFLALAAAGKPGPTARAYSLMSPEFRKTCDLPCFSRRLGANPAEIAALSRAPLPAPAVSAQVMPPGDAPWQLVLQPAEGKRGAAWRISGDPLDFYPQDTPEHALRSFVRAVEARRYDVLVRFTPERYRAQVTPELLRQRWEGEHRAELRAQLDAVKRHLGQPPVVSLGEGEPGKADHGAVQEALLPVGESPIMSEARAARLVLEEGRWRIVQLE